MFRGLQEKTRTKSIKSARTASLCSCLLLLVALAATTACGQQAANTAAAQRSATPQTTSPQGSLFKEVPDKIDPHAYYLFYLHGRIIEEQGPRPTSPQHGVYEYQEILDAFASRGFTVISEARPKGTDAQQYAAKVVTQIKALLKAGVKPRQITVVGASKGGGIAMATSTLLKNREVNFAILAACGDFDQYKKFPPDLWGNVLSIWDYKDEGLGSCRKFFDQSKGLNQRKEIELKLGLGHGILYKPLKEWIDPVVEWAKRS
jgi:hypothetical protein